MSVIIYVMKTQWLVGKRLQAPSSFSLVETQKNLIKNASFNKTTSLTF